MVEPDEIREPTLCPYCKCGGPHFRLRHGVAKPVRATISAMVTAQRYGCRRCRRTFRVCRPGVNHALTSRRVNGLAVMLRQIVDGGDTGAAWCGP